MIGVTISTADLYIHQLQVQIWSEGVAELGKDS